MQVAQLEEDLKRNYTLNVGKCIETLREEVPRMLEEAPTLDVFTEGVRLVDERGNVITSGRRAYGAFYAGLRMARRLSMTTPRVDVLSVRYVDWSGEIHVRFSVEADAPLGLDRTARYDAVSVYKLDSEGWIKEHKVDDTTRLNIFDRTPALFSNPAAVLFGGSLNPQPVPLPF